MKMSIKKRDEYQCVVNLVNQHKKSNHLEVDGENVAITTAHSDLEATSQNIDTVRGLAVNSRQPYLFSCGEDKQVKCWDLEYNKVIRHYHGHLSAVYSLALHPTIDVLITYTRVTPTLVTPLDKAKIN